MSPAACSALQRPPHPCSDAGRIQSQRCAQVRLLSLFDVAVGISESRYGNAIDPLFFQKFEDGGAEPSLEHVLLNRE